MIELESDSTAAQASESAVVRLVLGIVTALVLVVGVVAVLTDDGDANGVEIEDPVAMLGAAPDAVREQGSARMTMTMEMTGEGIPNAIRMTADGVTDFVTGAGRMELSAMGTDFEMRTDGTTMWMRMPALLGGVGSKPWVAVPLRGEGGFTPDSAFVSPDTASGYLEGLRGVGSDIEDVGVEEVNGVVTRHYRATIDPRKAAAELPEGARSDSIEQGLAALGDSTMPMDVWLSEDGLPIRTTFTLNMNDLFSMSMQIDLTDFGVPVHVEAPPADEVRELGDFSELMTVFGGDASSID